MEDKKKSYPFAQFYGGDSAAQNKGREGGTEGGNNSHCLLSFMVGILQHRIKRGREGGNHSHLFAQFHGGDSVAKQPSHPVVPLVHRHCMSSLDKDKFRIHSNNNLCAHLVLD